MGYAIRRRVRIFSQAVARSGHPHIHGVMKRERATSMSPERARKARSKTGVDLPIEFLLETHANHEVYQGTLHVPNGEEWMNEINDAGCGMKGKVPLH